MFISSFLVDSRHASFLSVKILFSTITVDNFVDKVWAHLISDVSITDFFIRPFFGFKKTVYFQLLINKPYIQEVLQKRFFENMELL
ncbi:MAG: hypothetical protein ABS69_21440 [Nitrosomonadales bacterium SCN 54-20]|nr:MAG: hypothetical protein ABS69_21440 [Nitrosomonadales bacterium SCN 54-20]